MRFIYRPAVLAGRESRRQGDQEQEGRRQREQEQREQEQREQEQREQEQREQEMNCNIGSVYICVENMDRAIQFYEGFFEQSVTERDNIYSVFTINGFRFGLFAYRLVNESHTFGSNCLPSISVENVDVLSAKIESREICFPLTKIGKNWVAEFIDSEGNHIEITAPV